MRQKKYQNFFYWCVLVNIVIFNSSCAPLWYSNKEDSEPPNKKKQRPITKVVKNKNQNFPDFSSNNTSLENKVLDNKNSVREDVSIVNQEISNDVSILPPPRSKRDELTDIADEINLKQREAEPYSAENDVPHEETNKLQEEVVKIKDMPVEKEPIVSSSSSTKPVVSESIQSVTQAVNEEPAKLQPVLGNSISDCPPDAKQEYEHVKTAQSDSDKLFFLKRVLRLCGKNPAVRIELGKVYQSLGRVEDAKNEYRAALDIDPKSKDARSMLEQFRY